MKRKLAVAIFLCLLATSPIVHAGDFVFDGFLNYHNDVVYFGFTLNSNATGVKIWTDSFQNGDNFDPLAAIWNSTGVLLYENDDDPTINPSTQDWWDSGFELDLTAGKYTLTVTPSDNLALGTTLADGFTYDGESPIPIEDWWVEGTGYYRVNFAGVDSATAVPEPATLLLVGTGLVGLVANRRRIKK